MKTFRDDLSREDVLGLLDYDRETGVFTWRRRENETFNKRFAGAPAGAVVASGVMVQIGGKKYAAHRLAWLIETGAWPAGEVDHKNVDNTDNRFDNLREASSSQNCANKKLSKASTSGLKGVSVCSSTGRWKAQICVNGEVLYLGLFETPEAANEAYAQAAARHFGEFARAA